jgi:hypothetical protein
VTTSRQIQGMRGVYLAAAELAHQGFIVAPTSRSARGADLLVTSDDCTRAFTVEVKAIFMCSCTSKNLSQLIIKAAKTKRNRKRSFHITLSQAHTSQRTSTILAAGQGTTRVGGLSGSIRLKNSKIIGTSSVLPQLREKVCESAAGKWIWWIILALGVGAIAQNRGDSFGRWFLVALMVSTPLALLYLIASPIKAAPAK